MAENQRRVPPPGLDPPTGIGADVDVDGDAAQPDDGVAADSAVDETRTEFALDEWAVEDRTLLDQLLIGEEIPHTWQGAVLVVSAGSQFVVDELIDAVEDGAVVEPEGSTSDAGRDADAADGEWDEEWDDGVDAQEVLGGVFIAADRLRRRANDPEGVLALVELADTVASMSLPFGFDQAVWADLVGAVGVLAAALTADEGNEADVGAEAIEALADDLRARLRPLV